MVTNMIEKIKFIIRVILYNTILSSTKFRAKKYRAEYIKNGKNSIPIFIINYNRLSYVKRFIEQLESFGLTNISIVDNCSTYPPLLEYYKTIPYKVFYMDKNYGYMVFWKHEMFKKFRNNFYVVSDPDLEFVSECPDDFLDVFVEKLSRYPFVRKVGFSLKIDDLPINDFTENIIKWERQYYRTKISSENMYCAGIDTTFAVYLPDPLVKRQKFLRAFRMDSPYQVRHLPWYKDENNLTEEDIYYSEHKTNGWSDPVKGFKKDEN